MAAGGSCCHTLRIPRGKGTLTPADLPEYSARRRRLPAILRMMTSTSSFTLHRGRIHGRPARDADVAAELAKITGKRVVTTASSMIAALEHIGARRMLITRISKPSTSG